MESIETELYGESGKRDGKGRQLLGENEWYRLLSEYDASGLTQKVFCKREGVKYGTFVAWMGRRKKKRDGGEALGCITEVLFTGQRGFDYRRKLQA